ncbi:MAG: DUF4382 domain-containing protein [Candidatus Thiodiazotropha sp.]
MLQQPFTRATPVLLLLLAGLLTACGGGSSSSGANPAISGSRGSVGVMLTDAPADPSLFAAINATIERVELIGGDGSRAALFEGPAETVDLMRLRNESVPFVFRDDVPVGTYCKVRLTLTKPNGLELVLLADGSSYFPKLPGNGKLDLLARDCFTVAPGASVTLQLDMDAANSIHIVKTGNKTDFNFRPVVFVDVINRNFTGKLVRLEGVIADLDAVAQSLLLCQALPTHRSNAPDCVAIKLGADAAFFDNLTLDGDAAPLSELLQESNMGQSAAAVGLVSKLIIDLEAPVVPAEELPGTDLCRLWQPSVDAVSQPYPDDLFCDDQGLTVPAGLVLIDDQGSVVIDHRPRLSLDGLAVETGDFVQVYGSAATDATTDGFTLNAPDTLAVTLQNPVSYNGTRILSKEGALLDYTAVVVPRLLKLDGVPISSSELKAAVVIVDTDMQGQVTASGVIGSLSSGGFTLIPEATTSPCGVNGDLSVQLAADAAMTTVTITSTLVDISPGGILAAGQSVGVSGLCGGAGLSATSVVIVDDQRP